MLVCTYVCMYVRMYACMYLCMYLCMHVYSYICMWKPQSSRSACKLLGYKFIISTYIY